MNAARRDPSEIDRRTDVASVVALLRRKGPLTLRDLRDEPEMADWPDERTRTAVTTAWSRTLIFVDPEDQLVAL